MPSTGGSTNDPMNMEGSPTTPFDPNAITPPPPPNPNAVEEEPAVASSCSTPTQPHALWGLLLSIFAWIQFLKRDQFKA